MSMTPPPPAPRAALKPLDDMFAELMAFAEPLGRVEAVSTFEADGRVLAQDVVSALTVPPRDNSSMDGYAVRAADVRSASTEHPVRLPVSGDAPAGTARRTALQPGTAIRIMTGAPVPDGADAVVPVEMTVYDDRTFTLVYKVSPMSRLILKALGIEKGSSKTPNQKAGTLTREQVRSIAQEKMPDLSAGSIEAAERIVEGTARSMGVSVK